MPDSSFYSSFAHNIYKNKYAHPGEEWSDTALRVTSNVMGALPNHSTTADAQDRVFQLIKNKQFVPGGRYLYATGRPFHQVNNCLLLRCEDSREGWAKLGYKMEMSLLTGAGVGVVWSDLREAGALIKKTGGVSSGPVPKMIAENEKGRAAVQGGNRRAAIWAGLHWNHQDVFRFIRIKDWPEEVRKIKEKDFNFPAQMDMTNVSVILDDEFFKAYEDADYSDPERPWATHEWAHDVYNLTCKQMLKTAEPGFSVDIGPNNGENLRNACTEITSRDDSDVCNLGSINIAAFDTKEQFASAVRDATLFLIAGTLYSDVPYTTDSLPEGELGVDAIRTKNRRLGLGVMGVHEWLLKHGHRYEPSDDLSSWLLEYERSTEFAHEYADRYGLSRPVKTRAIAPTGTIGIIAETTTGIEPIFSVAYKRRVRDDNPLNQRVLHEYVIDPTAKRLVDQGVPADEIEDAYTLSYDPDRRLALQQFMQRYVDHGISSTINLPGTITDKQEVRNFGQTLYKYLPNLRGVTVYPDGARGGQPLTNVPLDYALSREGQIYESEEELCVGGVCGV